MTDMVILGKAKRIESHESPLFSANATIQDKIQIPSFEEDNQHADSQRKKYKSTL